MVEIDEYFSPECASSSASSAANDNSSEEVTAEVDTIAPPTKAQRDTILDDLIKLSD